MRASKSTVGTDVLRDPAGSEFARDLAPFCTHHACPATLSRVRTARSSRRGACAGTCRTRAPCGARSRACSTSTRASRASVPGDMRRRRCAAAEPSSSATGASAPVRGGSSTTRSHCSRKKLQSGCHEVGSEEAAHWRCRSRGVASRPARRGPRRPRRRATRARAAQTAG